MATLFRCCFCQRVDSKLRNFEKKGKLIFCKESCNNKRLSDNKRKSKTVLNKQKGAKSKKKSGKGRGKNTNENKQKSIGKDDGGYTETLNERGGESQECESKIERKFHKPVSESENAAGDSVGQAFPSGHSSHIVKHSDHNYNPSATEVANSTMIDQVKKISLEVTNANDSIQPVKGKDKEDKNKCGDCAKPNCTKLCNRCKGTFYCSKECQRKDWSVHKEICVQRLTEEEQEIYKIYEEKTRQRRDYKRRCKEVTEETDGLNNIIIDDSEDSFDSSLDRMYQTLPLKQALIIAPDQWGHSTRHCV
ncbi:uncharacterized protein LOC132721452 [Ruditapes philippinarum]|uniref:uncharacterized protein LOC132721452 n=1 Tax=Ruditapes philippinarum TaxID=129788 RepID=UPI00295ABC7A|nr:uncharacterized protein LOC132721452 [Ruditapes philippinarum]